MLTLLFNTLCRFNSHLASSDITSIFIRICTTGEAPVDPPEEMANAVRQHQKARPMKAKKKQPKQSDPACVEELNKEHKTLQYNDDSQKQEVESAESDNKTFEEVSKDDKGSSKDQSAKEDSIAEEKAQEALEHITSGKSSGDVDKDS